MTRRPTRAVPGAGQARWVLGLAALVAVGSTGVARADAGPTLTATSVVQGRTLERPLVDGDWARDGQVWTVVLRTTALDGATVIRSTWRSPVLRPVRGTLRFAVAIDVDKQDVLGNYAYSEDARLCTRSGCDRWMNEGMDSTPSRVDPASLPWTVTFNHGIDAKWLPLDEPAWVEWRYVQRQDGNGLATTTIRVAVAEGTYSV
jgi:hypothetical protein